MKYVAFIPARGGSKGIPNKNVKNINGKPLINWSIETALGCKELDDVYVSTDSELIKSIALKSGAKVPFLRPESISGDLATTESAVLHFLDWCEVESIEIDCLLLIQATSPIRSDSSFSRAIKLFEEEHLDSLVTVSKTHRFIWKTPDKPTASYDIYNRPRRQDINSEDEIYFENGSFYISKIDIYQRFKNRLGGKIGMFEMTPEESFEIDDPLDFKITELLMKENCEE